MFKIVLANIIHTGIFNICKDSFQTVKNSFLRGRIMGDIFISYFTCVYCNVWNFHIITFKRNIYTCGENVFKNQMGYTNGKWGSELPSIRDIQAGAGGTWSRGCDGGLDQSSVRSRGSPQDSGVALPSGKVSPTIWGPATSVWFSFLLLWVRLSCSELPWCSLHGAWG